MVDLGHINIAEIEKIYLWKKGRAWMSMDCTQYELNACQGILCFISLSFTFTFGCFLSSSGRVLSQHSIKRFFCTQIDQFEEFRFGCLLKYYIPYFNF